MPDIAELKESLAKLRELVKQNLPRIATLVTLTAKAIAERRIKEKGFGEVYSTNPIPNWFLHGKELRASGRKYYTEAGLAGEGVTWKGFRQAQGLPVDHVDLTYSGFMFSGMLPAEPTEENGIVYAILSGNTKEAQDKMNWNRARYGDFIGRALQPEDFAILRQVIIDEIIPLIEESGIKFAA